MKKYILPIIIIIASLNCQALSNKFEITPIVINFQGVETKSDTIIAYGDFGSMLISYDNTINWKQVKVFDRGTIINLFWNDSGMTVFNDAGDIAISKDRGLKWDLVTNIDDSVFAVIKYPGGYLLRGRNKLFTITNEFQIKKEFPLFSTVLTYISTVDKPNYMKSIAYYKDNFIVETDSSTFIRFNQNLFPVDTLSFNKLGKFDSTYNYKSGYWLDVDTSNLYIKVAAVKKTDPKKSGILVCNVYRTDNFETIEKYFELRGTFSIFNISDNIFYPLNKTEKFLVDSTKVTEDNTNFFQFVNNFKIYNNKMIVVGKNKLIEIVELKDSSLKVISEFSRYSPYLVPEKIGESSYLFYSGDNYEYYPYIYRTDNNGLTFKPVVNNRKDTSPTDYNYNLFKLRFKYFDDLEHKIYFGGGFEGTNPTYVFITDDYFNSYIQKKINNYYINSIINMAFFINSNFSPNIQKIGDNFITAAAGVGLLSDTVVSGITTFTKEFDIKDNLIIHNIALDYFYAKDTNTFIIHCANAIDSTSEIRFTSDKGNSWKLIKKYPLSDTLSLYKEIVYKGTKYLTLIHRTTNSFKLDVVDLENQQFANIYEWIEDTTKPQWNWYGVGIEVDNKLVYITYQDTLFYTTDLLDKNKWQYQIVPNNGRIVCRPLKKFGNQFFARYTDDNILWGNGIFWIKPLDSITKVNDYIIEVPNYIYAYPPYPLPATKEVRSHIFGDMSFDIDRDEIVIYDVYGKKASGKENINIIKQTLYNGYLIWDCSNVENGIYFIRINHRTNSLTLKVLVIR